MTDFQFTEHQVAAISAPLRRRRFPAEEIAEFVAVAAIEINEWRRRWPRMDAADLAQQRRRLKEIEKHVAGLKYQLAALPSESRAALLIDLIQYRDPSWPEFGRAIGQDEWLRLSIETDLFLGALLAATGSQIEAGSRHNSRDTGRKVALVKPLAETFYGCFGKMPSGTHDGPFMEAVAAIGDAIGEPIGKDAVASGIKAFRTEREFMYGSGAD